MPARDRDRPRTLTPSRRVDSGAGVATEVAAGAGNDDAVSTDEEDANSGNAVPAPTPLFVEGQRSLQAISPANW